MCCALEWQEPCLPLETEYVVMDSGPVGGGCEQCAAVAEVLSGLQALLFETSLL
jgi:hypothetical protein